MNREKINSFYIYTLFVAKFGFCTENAILLMLEAMEQNNSEPLARKIIKNFYEKCQPACKYFLKIKPLSVLN